MTRNLLMSLIAGTAMAWSFDAQAARECDVELNEKVSMIADSEEPASKKYADLRRLLVFYDVCIEGDEESTEMMFDVFMEAFDRPGS